MRSLTPSDFIDERHCRWFILTKVKSGPNMRYACTTCSAISRTKECPAFKKRAADGECTQKEGT